MTARRIELPKKLIPVFDGPADVRSAYGGRGSGKTRSFAKMIAVRGYMFGMAGVSGQLLCGRQYMNSLDDSSLEECKRAIEEEPWLAAYYDVGDKYIKSRDGRIWFSFAGLDRSIESIKSKGRILICWVDEAEPVTLSAWSILIPTLREEGEDWNAELWVTWNPKRRTAAVESRFRNPTDPLIKCAELNWRDNPKFPAKLERERLRDKAERPDQYDHIWEGGFATVIEGAYYAASITQAKAEGRIGKVAADPLMTVRLFCDIGGTGARADAFTIWAAQFIGREIRVIDYYEAVGQPLASHLNWMRERKYTPDRAQIWLPHDGSSQDKVFDVSYESSMIASGYNVTVVPNQGKGAASARIESGRRLFPQIWFDAERTDAGIAALGWYHEKRDDQRNIGLGPEHDWSSHGCLTGDALIDTPDGKVAIRDIRTGDSVLTPSGQAHVSWAGRTKIASELIEITFDDGVKITATPEHKFLTTGGLLKADSLRYNDAVFSLETAPCISLANVSKMGYRAAFIASFKESNIGFGVKENCIAHREMACNHFSTACCLKQMMVDTLISLAMLFRAMEIGKISSHQTGAYRNADQIGQKNRSICQYDTKAYYTTRNQTDITRQSLKKVESFCIGQYGLMNPALFRKATISTISTAIKAITESKISNCFQLPIMQSIMRKVTLGSGVKGIRSISMLSDIKQSCGTHLKRVCAGIERTGKWLGPIGSLYKRFVQNADRHTKRSMSEGLNSARKVARLKRITGVAVPVYDLTVDHHHCYVANGVIVSNSDSFGLMCVAYEEPQVKKAAMKRPRNNGATGWMR